LNNKCPTFIKQKGIMAIKTIENVDFHKSTPYSQVASQAPSNSIAPALDK